MFIKVLGFAPDLDPATPGVIVDASSIYPSIKGIKAFPSEVDGGFSDVSATVQGSVQVRLLDDTLRTFVGSAGRPYESSAGGFGNVSRSATDSISYAVGVNQWRFTQYGDRTYAAGKGEPLQEMSAGGAEFHDVSGAPKAAIVEAVGDFIMVFDTDDSTGVVKSFGAQPDRWWCPGIANTLTWTPDIATQAATGRLTQSPGAIIGGKRLGKDIIAYKLDSMYKGIYVGTPLVWGWLLLPGEVGALNHDCIISIDTAHFFISLEDFYYFDGVRPRPIGTNTVREFFFNNFNEDQRAKILGLHDRRNFIVVWFFPSSGSLNVDRYVAYNYRSQRWGFGTTHVRGVLEHSQAGIVYDDLGTLYTTYDDIPTNIAYDTAFAVQFSPRPAIFDENNRLKFLTGVGQTNSYKTGDFGVDGQPSVVARRRPRFITVPAMGTQEHRVKDQAGDTELTAQSTALISGKFDSLQEARWHSFVDEFSGDWELTGWDIEIGRGSAE